MAPGDETIMGPFATDAAGLVSAGSQMEAAYVTANDKYVHIGGANGLQFWIIHIEAA